MVQIHPSLPTMNIDSNHVWAVKNPSRSASANSQLVHHWQFHRIPFGFGLPDLGKPDLGVDRFQGQPKSDRFDFQAHVEGECSTLRFPR